LTLDFKINFDFDVTNCCNKIIAKESWYQCRDMATKDHCGDVIYGSLNVSFVGVFVQFCKNSTRM